MEKATLSSFKNAANLENSRWYMGHLFTWLVSAEQTGGKFSILETHIRKGLEPPPHTHSIESETYYITEGEMVFTAGDKTYHAGPGDCVYLPPHVEHAFQLKTDTAKCTILMEPGGFEKFFIDFSVPAEALTLPPAPEGPPPPDLAKRFVESLATYGVDMPLPQ